MATNGGSRIALVFCVCLFFFHADVAQGEDNCDETCEQIKFDKVKEVTNDLRSSCREMEGKIDSLESMLESLEDERKWTLALKVEAGSHICVSCAWSNPATHHPQTYMQAVDLKTPCGCAFVNHQVLNDWDQLFQSKMTQVSVTFWNRTADDVVRVASALFDGRDSRAQGRDSWFQENRLLDSSFEDLKDISHFSHKKGRFFTENEEMFSFAISASGLAHCQSGEGGATGGPKAETLSEIAGPEPESSVNEGFVEATWKFVGNATGWMMVAQKTPECVDGATLARLTGAMDRRPTRFPAFLYMEDAGAGPWNGPQLRAADFMTIFVR